MDIRLIFWLIVLTSNIKCKRVAEEETLTQLLKEKFENESQDDLIIDSLPDLSSDEDVNLHFSDKTFDDFGLINDKPAEHFLLSMCGKPEIEPDINQKIVNGKPAKPHSWPWQVSLKIKENGIYRHDCGGSIITNKIVITAAHCVTSYHISDLLVVAGAHKVYEEESVQKKSKIKNIIMHNFNDIAVLVLETPFTFNKEISPICLPKNNSVASGTCYATGWGLTNGTGDANILNQVKLPVVKEDVCAKHFNQAINRELLCAGLDEGKTACSSDSGGPFVCLDTNSTRWYLHGITSFGDFCKTLTVFTRVVYFLDWIIENTEQY